jgi:hypothetical protein
MIKQKTKKIKKASKWALREFIGEKKEERYLEIIKQLFEEGDLKEFLKKLKKAEGYIRRREKRITYRLIRAVKNAGIMINGKPADVFEKNLLAKHKDLYSLLDRMIINDVPNDTELPELISKSLELEKSIIQDIEGLYLELKKEAEQLSS